VLITNLAASMPAADIRCVQLEPDDTDVLSAAQSAIGDERPAALMIIGVERLLADPSHAAAVCSDLNLRRTEWLQRVPVPVALWVPKRFAGSLTRGAPDFLDWRSDTIEFPEEARLPHRARTERDWLRGLDPRLDEAQRRQRVEELRARIAAAREHLADGEVLRHVLQWWDELAEHLVLLGEPTEALRIYTKEVLPVYERLGDGRGLAITRTNLAALLYRLRGPACHEQVRGLLEWSLHAARRMRLPEAEAIEQITRDLLEDQTPPG